MALRALDSADPTCFGVGGVFDVGVRDIEVAVELFDTELEVAEVNGGSGRLFDVLDEFVRPGEEVVVLLFPPFLDGSASLAAFVLRVVWIADVPAGTPRTERVESNVVLRVVAEELHVHRTTTGEVVPGVEADVNRRVIVVAVGAFDGVIGEEDVHVDPAAPVARIDPPEDSFVFAFLFEGLVGGVVGVLRVDDGVGIGGDLPAELDIEPEGGEGFPSWVHDVLVVVDGGVPVSVVDVVRVDGELVEVDVGDGFDGVAVYGAVRVDEVVDGEQVTFFGFWEEFDDVGERDRVVVVHRTSAIDFVGVFCVYVVFQSEEADAIALLDEVVNFTELRSRVGVAVGVGRRVSNCGRRLGRVAVSVGTVGGGGSVRGSRQ